MVENEDYMSPLTPNARMASPSSKAYRSIPGTLDKRMQTEALSLLDVPTEDEQPQSMMAYDSNLGISFPTTQATTSASNIHSTGEFTPMAQLIQEYSSAIIESQLGPLEMGITLVLGLEELTLEHIVDRGENRTRGLPRYHLAKATMDNVCAVVTAQQTYLQRAAALIVERKSHFIVNPGDTLTSILQGTSSLPQLHTAWGALLVRIKQGVKAWKKYIMEYQQQVDAAALSST